MFEGKKYVYHADFLIKEFNMLIEIKGD